MYALLIRFLPLTAATLLTAAAYTALIFLIVAVWNIGRTEFRYLQV